MPVRRTPLFDDPENIASASFCVSSARRSGGLGYKPPPSMWHRCIVAVADGAMIREVQTRCALGFRENQGRYFWYCALREVRPFFAALRDCGFKRLGLARELSHRCRTLTQPRQSKLARRQKSAAKEVPRFIPTHDVAHSSLQNIVT